MVLLRAGHVRQRSRSCSHCCTATKLLPSRPAPAPCSSGRSQRRLVLRVLGAVFITCEVAAMTVGATAVAKGIHHLIQPQTPAPALLHLARQLHQFTRSLAAQPTAQRHSAWTGDGHPAPRPRRQSSCKPGHGGPQQLHQVAGPSPTTTDSPSTSPARRWSAARSSRLASAMQKKTDTARWQGEHRLQECRLDACNMELSTNSCQKVLQGQTFSKRFTPGNSQA
jgi:hypothetical protein